jgi:hypothetical protein
VENNRPELGHDPRKISLIGKKNTIGVELKQGHHDLMSNDFGFDPFSQFDFLGLTLVYDEHKHKVLYDQFTFVDLVSLHPYSFYDPQFSWQGTVGGDHNNAVFAKAFAGISFYPYQQSVVSFLGGLVGDLDTKYKHNYKLLPTGKVIFLSNLGTKAKLGLFDEFSASQNSLEVNLAYFLTKNTELRLNGERKVIQLGYGYFF